jgi:hypothetical protein
MTEQEFRTFQNSSTPEGQRTVSVDPQGDLENIEVNWSTFEFTQTQTTLQRPDQVTLFVKVEGYPLARPLYYSLTGTLINTDFVNGLDVVRFFWICLIRTFPVYFSGARI